MCLPHTHTHAHVQYLVTTSYQLLTVPSFTQIHCLKFSLQHKKINTCKQMFRSFQPCFYFWQYYIITQVLLLGTQNTLQRPKDMARHGVNISFHGPLPIKMNKAATTEKYIRYKNSNKIYNTSGIASTIVRYNSTGQVQAVLLTYLFLIIMHY